MTRTVAFENLETADLVVDALYMSGSKGHAGDDPLGPLLGVSNQGGFRYRGDIEGNLDLLMILSTFADPNWPDVLDRETGVLTYYGDNQKPGGGLHETGKRGNRVLRRIFEDAYGDATKRARVPPTFVFGRSAPGRSAVFLGLAVPGVSDVREGEDLAALWKTSNEERFQNYRSRFSVLDAGTIKRRWIASLIAGEEAAEEAPAVWTDWKRTGRRKRLVAPRSVEWRTRQEQQPDPEGQKLLDVLIHHFRDRPVAFEACAVELARLLLPDIERTELTRPSRDGGRDAIGICRLGRAAASITIEFALEAKCFSAPNAVGVRYLSRLISRLRHRQFGIMVTTTWVDRQAYREIVEDGHPIIVLAGSDIVDLLRKEGLHDTTSLTAWLTNHFPAGT